MRFLKRALPNITIAFAVSMIVIVIVHSHNPMMGFLTGTPFMILSFLFCGLSIATSLTLYFTARKKKRRVSREDHEHRSA